MEGIVLDQYFNNKYILDVFDSFIWTDRYLGCGEFEIYTPLASLRYPIEEEDYIYLGSSDRLMIIEAIAIDTNIEEGARVTISGRSLELLLERRIVWARTALSGSFQDAIQQLLMENVINPTDPNRKMAGFTFKPSSDPAILAMTVEADIAMGDDLYETIFSLCEVRQIGFRVLPVGAGGFEFELYNGVDRSYAQNLRPYVIFSPSFDNFLSSNSFESRRALKTAALTVGWDYDQEIDIINNKIAIQEPIEQAAADKYWNSMNPITGENGPNTYAFKLLWDVELDKLNLLYSEKAFINTSYASNPLTLVDVPGAQTDIKRREVFVTTKLERNEEITFYQYIDQLNEMLNQELAKTKITKSFEGEIEAKHQFIYGKDFFIGDIVQVVNEYGMERFGRISELIQSHNGEGEGLYPTFTMLEEE